MTTGRLVPEDGNRRISTGPAAHSRVLAAAARRLLPVLFGAVVLAGQAPVPGVELREGAIVRGPVDRKQLALVFTGHEFAEGGDAILDALGARNVKASFFLTGVFLRNEAFAPLVHRMVREGHYVGAHSDEHLLYCPWEGPKTTLVTREQFESDLTRNYERLARFGIARERAPLYVPPYEWYNEEIAEWTRGLGLTLICHTRGTRSNADYTEEGTPQFVSSQAIFDSILRREQEEPHGLSGFILLLHVGAGPGRTDKFHPRVGALVDVLRERGYTFVRVDELLR
ncbi:MAG TPA: polysaccharide deacetylase family protein [Vicinamibacterales bacterium]